MQANAQDPGVVTWTNNTGSDIAIATDPVVDLGQRIGVALVDIANGASGSVLTLGVMTLAKDSSTISEGDILYWNSTAHQLTTTQAAGYDRVGIATRARATGDSYADVDLNAPKTVGDTQIDSGAGDAAGNQAAIVQIIGILDEAGLSQKR